MSTNKTAQRRWWQKQQPQENKTESVAAAVPEEEPVVAAPDQVTVGDMTKEELGQMITAAVQLALEDYLPKQLARQRAMMESELKWHLNDLMMGVAVAGGADTAADQQEEEPVPKLNPSIDWSFLE
jgi:hypothetical protein